MPEDEQENERWRNFSHIVLFDQYGDEEESKLFSPKKQL
jgi:hypothetical protein